MAAFSMIALVYAVSRVFLKYCFYIHFKKKQKYERRRTAKRGLRSGWFLFIYDFWLILTKLSIYGSSSRSELMIWWNRRKIQSSENVVALLRRAADHHLRIILDSTRSVSTCQKFQFIKKTLFAFRNQRLNDLEQKMEITTLLLNKIDKVCSFFSESMHSWAV